MTLAEPLTFLKSVDGVGIVSDGTKLVVVAKPSQFAEPAGRLRSRKVMHKAASKRF